MLQGMLAKMASKLGSKEEPEMDEIEMDNMGPGDEDPDARYKAGAIIAEFRPKLQEALRKKDPAKYDEFMNKMSQMRKEGGDLLRQGKIEEGKKKMMEASSFAEEGDLEIYLEPSEIKNILGNDYDKYMQAVSVAFAKPGQYRVKKVTGEKEAGQVETLSDVKFGKRMMSMPVATGIEGKGVTRFYKYNPKTGEVEIDKERTQ